MAAGIGIGGLGPERGCAGDFAIPVETQGMESEVDGSGTAVVMETNLKIEGCIDVGGSRSGEVYISRLPLLVLL
jgi:hypothetical protein